MTIYEQKAMELRSVMGDNGKPKYNCAQAVVSAFAEALGYDQETACRTAALFRAGMQMGSVCGAVTGGLMVLGLAGLKGPEVTDAYYGKFRERHGDMINCADLLRAGAERGEQKLPWCNALIRECIGYVEEALREQGKL